MVISRFEAFIQKEMQAVLDGMLNLPLGDSLRHAELKGMHKGLSSALKQHRLERTTDDDKDSL